MESMILIVHVLAALCLIILVLLQNGKGAEAGAAFGSGAATVFGSQGAGQFLTKATAFSATLFFMTSLVLGYLLTQQQQVNIDLDSIEQQQAVLPD